MARWQDSSEFFGKTFHKYSNLTGEALPQDPQRNLSNLIYKSSSASPTNNSGMLYDAQGNPVNMMNNPMMQMMATMLQGNMGNNNNNVIQKSTNNNSPNMDAIVASATDRVISQLRSDPDAMKKSQDPNVMKALIKSEVNREVAKSNGQYYNQAQDYINVAQSVGLKNANDHSIDEAQILNVILSKLTEDNASDLLAIRDKVAITLEKTTIEQMAKEGKLNSLKQLIDMKLVIVTKLDNGDLLEYRLSKLGKMAIKALGESQ